MELGILTRHRWCESKKETTDADENAPHRSRIFAESHVHGSVISVMHFPRFSCTLVNEGIGGVFTKWLLQVLQVLDKVAFGLQKSKMVRIGVGR